MPEAPSKKKRAGVPLHVWLPEDVSAAFDRYLASLEPSPTQTSAVILALRQFLARAGFWPPSGTTS